VTGAKLRLRIIRCEKTRLNGSPVEQTTVAPE